MVAAAASDPFHRYTLENGIVLWGVTEDRIGKKYADGIDNNFDGQIDESIDEGIDDPAEAWYEGLIMMGMVKSMNWMKRSGFTDPGRQTAPGYGFGDFTYTADGKLVFDTNGDGIYEGVDDFKMNYGGLTTVIKDANGDGLDDYPDFDVENFRYDIRADWEINPDLTVSFSPKGYAKARNINITGIARYIAMVGFTVIFRVG
ncbi:MAG: hypothetical protein CM1200mP10_13860 [Candidatus Neomarinimicrobiota bacterium]|nr:MAG: hypothetical protein CM1200mP10_13860 [Candidatus Neomarinimicrobiota bacterium]